MTGTRFRNVRATSGNEDPATLFKPARPVRAFEEIIAQIRALIDDGRLSVGDKLPPERVLAERLEVSRNTVREALRTLEISGIVTLRRGASGGAFIAEPPRDQLDYLNQSLRFTDFSVTDFAQAMHAMALMLFQAALPTIGEEDFAAMERNVAEAEVIEDAALRSAATVRFYVLLAQASRNKILVALAETFTQILLSWVIRLGSLSGGRVFVSRRAIIRELRAGNARAAQTELEDYLKALHQLWLSGEPKTPPAAPVKRRAATRNAASGPA